MNRAEIKNLIRFAAGSLPNMQNKDLTEIGKSWEEMLGGLSYQQAREALRRVLRSARFWPTVSEILDAVDAIAEERERQTFRAGEKASCPNCAGMGFIGIMQDGEERFGRCPCAAGENYCGLPMVPAWAVVSDRRLLTSGEEVEAIDF